MIHYAKNSKLGIAVRQPGAELFLGQIAEKRH